MSVKSGASALGSILLGGMSDRLGRLPSFALSALGQLVFVVYFCCFRVVPDGKRFALMFTLAALFGFSQGGGNAVTAAVVPESKTPYGSLLPSFA